MIESTELTIIYTVGLVLSGINFAITFVLNIGWMILCTRRCCSVIKKYRICKQTPNLHPIYRDVQYLSQQRKLYNLKTHIVKYVLIVMCLVVEISTLVWAGVYAVTIGMHLNSNITAKWVKIQSHYPDCEVPHYFILLYEFPLLIIFYSFGFVLFFLLFVLLSILTRYLAARYLNHPFKRTLIKYIIWLGIQLVVVAICSTIYTFIFTSVVYPFLLIVNWFVLLRDNLKLSRVLKSNLREIELHSNNKALYREQLSAYRFYRFFQKIMLISLFLLVIVVVAYMLLFSISLVIHGSFCFFDVVYGVNYNLDLQIPLSSYKVYDYFLILFEAITLVLHSLTTSLPLLCVTFIPFILACVKRYKSRHFVYRFNYENIDQPLMRGCRK